MIRQLTYIKIHNVVTAPKTRCTSKKAKMCQEIQVKTFKIKVFKF